MGKNDKPNPLVSQIRKMLNSYGQMSEGNLSKAGSNLPILKQVLAMGYGNENFGDKHHFNSLASMTGGMSDRDAIGAAIDRLRGGEGLTGGHFGSNTASDNILKSMLAEKMATGMYHNKADARNAIKQQVNQELRFAKTAGSRDFGKSTLTPEEQQAMQAKLAGGQAAGQAGGQGNDPTAPPGWNPSRGMYDPVALANTQAQGSYYNQGANDIAQYQQVAGLMGGMVPEQLRPLYDLMTQQRAQEMQDNLTLSTSQMQAQPYIQQMKDAATDYRTAQKGGSSSGGVLSQLLNGQQPQTGTGQGGVGGSYSSGGLNGLDLSRQLQNQLALGQYMGNNFTKFQNPVISNSQMTYLRDFIPRSNKGWNQVPAVAQYLGASGY